MVTCTKIKDKCWTNQIFDLPLQYGRTETTPASHGCSRHGCHAAKGSHRRPEYAVDDWTKANVAEHYTYHERRDIQFFRRLDARFSRFVRTLFHLCKHCHREPFVLP